MTAPNSTTSRRQMQRHRTDRAEERVEVACYPHTAHQQIRAAFVRIGGKWLMDVRKFVKVGPNAWLGTSRGLTLPLSELDQLAGVIAELRAQQDRVKGRELEL